MEAPNLDGLLSTLVILGIIIGGVIWGGWELIDYFFIEDAIIVTEPLKPEIRITVKDNVIDTLYVYKKP